MIGKAYISIMPFFDMASHKNSFKARPCLIIGQADSQDFIILPISRITDSRRIDPDYDYPLEPSTFPALHLTTKSYVRTHKQTTIHLASLVHSITDFKNEYTDAFIDILTLVDQFQKQLISDAL